MSVLLVMLDALEHRMGLKDYALMKEKTTSPIACFPHICRLNPNIRKYLKEVIIPSGKRPAGQRLRGKLLRLMQTEDSMLKVSRVTCFLLHFFIINSISNLSLEGA